MSLVPIFNRKHEQYLIDCVELYNVVVYVYVKERGNGMSSVANLITHKPETPVFFSPIEESMGIQENQAYVLNLYLRHSF
jgi:hypothetical protein